MKLNTLKAHLCSPEFAVTFSNWLRVAVAFSARKVSSSVVSCQNKRKNKVLLIQGFIKQTFPKCLNVTASPAVSIQPVIAPDSYMTKISLMSSCARVFKHESLNNPWTCGKKTPHLCCECYSPSPPVFSRLWGFPFSAVCTDPATVSPL